jgi:hypothetical protein
MAAKITMPAGSRRMRDSVARTGRSDGDERQVRNHVPKIGNAEQRALVREVMIGLILRDGRQQQESQQRRQHGAQQDQNGAVLLCESVVVLAVMTYSYRNPDAPSSLV